MPPKIEDYNRDDYDAVQRRAFADGRWGREFNEPDLVFG